MQNEQEDEIKMRGGINNVLRGVCMFFFVLGSFLNVRAIRMSLRQNCAQQHAFVKHAIFILLCKGGLNGV